MAKQITIGPDTYERAIQERDRLRAEADDIDRAITVFFGIARLSHKTEALIDRVRARATGAPREQGPSAIAFIRQHADFNLSGPVANEIRRLLTIAAAQGLAFTYGGLSSAYYNTKKAGPVAAPAPAARASLPLLEGADRPVTSRAFAEQHAHLKGTTIHGEARRLVAVATAQGLTFTPKAIESVLRRMQNGVPGRTKSTSQHAKRHDEKRLRAKAGTRPKDVILATLRGAKEPLTRDQIIEQTNLVQYVRDPKYVRQSAAKALESLERDKDIKNTKGGFVAYKLKAHDHAASTNGAHGAHP